MTPRQVYEAAYREARSETANLIHAIDALEYMGFSIAGHKQAIWNAYVSYEKREKADYYARPANGDTRRIHRKNLWFRKHGINALAYAA